MGKSLSFRNLWRVFLARREAVQRLRPFVDRATLESGACNESRWLSPYVLGYVITAITIVARGSVAALEDEALGLVQIEAWEQLTGLDGARAGERMLGFSLGNDSGFVQGCSDGLAFGHLLMGRSPTIGADLSHSATAPVDVAIASYEQAVSLQDVWARGVGAKLLGT